MWIIDIGLTIRTECPFDMKQMALEWEFCKLLSYARKLILTFAQFSLVLPEHLINEVLYSNSIFLGPSRFTPC